MERILSLITDSEAYYPIYSRIADHLEVKDILALSRTCKKYSTYYRDLKATQWNINTILQTFFSNPIEFRSLQGETGTLITSSVALRFFHRSATSVGHGLALYVQKGDNCTAMVNYIEKQGYTKNENDSDNAKYVYVRARSEVRLHSTNEVPLCRILRKSYHTARANVISWNKAYCLFPISTLKWEFYPMSFFNTSAHGSFSRMFQQMASVGFKVRSLTWENNNTRTKEMAALQGQRSLADKHSWVIDLDTAGVKDPGVPDHILDNATFDLDITKQNSAIHYISLLCTGIMSPILKYTYVYSRNRPKGAEFFGIRRLKELELMAFSMLDVADRPSEYNAIVQGTMRPSEAMGKFKLPSWWQYYDDEVEPMFRVTSEENDENYYPLQW